MKTRGLEEADTLLILYAIDVAKEDLFSECYVLSPNTNISLLVLRYYILLLLVTYSRIWKGSITQSFEIMGEELIAAILDMSLNWTLFWKDKINEV